MFWGKSLPPAAAVTCRLLRRAFWKFRRGMIRPSWSIGMRNNLKTQKNTKKKKYRLFFVIFYTWRYIYIYTLCEALQFVLASSASAFSHIPISLPLGSFTVATFPCTGYLMGPSISPPCCIAARRQSCGGGAPRENGARTCVRETGGKWRVVRGGMELKGASKSINLGQDALAPMLVVVMGDFQRSVHFVR